MPTTGGYAATLRDTLPARWDAVGRPFPLAVLDRAIGLAGDLSGPTPPVLVNRDLHYSNVLRGRREPWLAVDPLPLAGDVEHQCGQLLWTRLDELPVLPAALALLWGHWRPASPTTRSAAPASSPSWPDPTADRACRGRRAWTSCGRTPDRV